MAQHFLLTAAARTLSLKAIYQAGDEAAYETFKTIRWNETAGAPVCPRCGSLEHYSIPTRRKFKCAAAECRHQFSVTSGTIFASRKMSFTDLLASICIFVNAVKGISACQLSRDLDCQYKTAFVLAHKLRESLNAEIAGLTLDDEADGGSVVIYVLNPKFSIEYYPDMACVARSVRVPRNTVATVQVRPITSLQPCQEDIEGIITRLEFVSSRDDNPTLPKGFDDRYETLLWRK